jgi:hypothetical protein
MHDDGCGRQNKKIEGGFSTAGDDFLLRGNLCSHEGGDSEYGCLRLSRPTLYSGRSDSHLPMGQFKLVNLKTLLRRQEEAIYLVPIESWNYFDSYSHVIGGITKAVIACLNVLDWKRIHA